LGSRSHPTQHRRMGEDDWTISKGRITGPPHHLHEV
jgi:hypothetical protein